MAYGMDVVDAVMPVAASRRQRRAVASRERRSARRDRHAAAQAHVMPLELRIMMDATLDFGADHVYDYRVSLNEAGTVSDLLNTAINLVEEMGAFGYLLRDELAEAMGDSVSLFSSDEDNPYLEQSSAFVETEKRATDDTFAKLEDFATEVGESLLGSVKSDVATALGSVRAAMAGEIND